MKTDHLYMVSSSSSLSVSSTDEYRPVFTSSASNGDLYVRVVTPVVLSESFECRKMKSRNRGSILWADEMRTMYNTTQRGYSQTPVCDGTEVGTMGYYFYLHPF